MRKQRGVTLTGAMAWAVVFIFAALLAFKIGPAYIEYFAIQKNLRAIAGDPEAASGKRGPIEKAFGRRSEVDDMSSIGPADLEIEKDGDQVTISASYAKRIPLFGHVSICLDFNPTSAK